MYAVRVLLVVVVSSTVVVALTAQTAVQDHPGTYDRAQIEAGSRLYSTQCVACHGPNGDAVAGIDLRRGRFRTAATDEDLTRVLTNGSPAAGMPSFGAYSSADLTALIAYVRAGFDADAAAVRVGDATRGGDLFRGKAGCATCHRVNGVGPHIASDLSDIGAIRSAASLQRALVNPAGAMLPANRSVSAVTRDGRTVRGRRLNEDTYTIQIIDDQNRLVSLTKSELRRYDVGSTSSMPSYESTLSVDERADVVAYLISLKGL